jgi:hypothetical protein
MDTTRSRVAAKVRHLASQKFPYTPFQSGPKETLRRALGYVDRRTMNDRWVGRRDYTLTELSTLAELLDVPLADLLTSPEHPRDGSLPTGDPGAGTGEGE